MDPREPDDRFVHPVCKQCGGRVFTLLGGDDAIARVCVRCIQSDDSDTSERAIHYICDSEEHWEDEDEFGCPCGKSDHFRLSVAFSHVDVVDRRGRNPRRLVKWIHVGGMCVRCGVVGLYADWKIDYAPTGHLYKLA
jgi:hypothetical protein